MNTSLVSLIRQGDREAFSILFEQFWKSLLSYAGKRLVLPQDAEEVVQEVFVNLWERRESLQINSSIDAYLHTAVRYKIYNRYRDFLHRKEVYRIPGLDEADYLLPEADTMEYKELEKQLATALSILPERCREVFLLSREEKLANKAIALKLNISVNTVEKHIGKALQILRIHLKQEHLLILLLTFGFMV